MKKKKLSREKKQLIIEETLVGGVILSDVAKKYNMSPKTLCAWRKQHRVSQDKANEFVEIQVSDDSSGSILNKACLDFKDCSLSLEGEIKSTRLIEIINILVG